jgi:hypothetical protein
MAQKAISHHQLDLILFFFHTFEWGTTSPPWFCPTSTHSNIQVSQDKRFYSVPTSTQSKIQVSQDKRFLFCSNIDPL